MGLGSTDSRGESASLRRLSCKLAKDSAGGCAGASILRYPSVGTCCKLLVIFL